jgi:DNA invertase Pin-like site-specific DNA recombinase
MKPKSRHHSSNDPSPPRQAVPYGRVSSDEQEREGYSLPSQMKSLHEYAKREGFTIVKEYIDIDTAK